MNTENDALQLETGAAVSSAPQASSAGKIPKAAWYVGGGCLALLCCAAVVALAVAGYTYFAHNDPIAKVVPGDALVYMQFDFAQSQSASFNELVPVFQGIAGVEKKMLIDALDEALQDELGLSFKEEALPWLGQHGAFVITEGSLMDEDFDFMLIMEARDKDLADAFIAKFTAALETQNGVEKFEPQERDGVTLYVSESEFGPRNDIVFARADSFVYLANSVDAVAGSLNLKSADALARSERYRQVISVLPAQRLAQVYFSKQATAEIMLEMSRELGAVAATQFESDGINGMGLSVSVQDEGLRLDAAIAYDETKVSELKKAALQAKYQAPQADRLIPANTIFFLDTNSSLSPAQTLQPDNPAYTQDMQESFDLLENQYGVSVTELFKLLTGEFALAIAPSNDGILVEQADVNAGFAIFAATDNEAGFNDWMKDALDALAQDAYVTFDTTEVAINGYDLQRLSVEEMGLGDIALYGADNGYIIFGSSQDMLEQGLGGKETLADNSDYQQTWKAFPSGSVPYLYFNLPEFLDLYKSMPVNDDLGDAEADLRRIPVIAAVRNQNADYVSSVTAIIFVNAK